MAKAGKQEKSAGVAKVTPFMRQYEDAKALHPDAILFFRMGDFYEMFRDDAVTAARVLGLTLTARNKGAPDEIPMAGVPWHAAHGYIGKLLAGGFKIALCEQMADPAKCKGIVPREVVRVLTPSLVTDGDQLDARENQWLAAIDVPVAAAGAEAGGVGFALLDLSTGELLAATVDGASVLAAEIARSDPREVLVGGDPARAAEVSDAIRALAPKVALRSDAPLFAGDDDVADAIDRLLDDAAEVPIAKEARRAAVDAPALAAAARAVRFAHACTPRAKLPVRRLAPYELSATMRIDETAQVHLEIVRAQDGSREGTLLDVVDATVSPAGARLLRRRLLAPLLDVAAIRRRHDEVEVFVAHARSRAELREALKSLGDLERLAVRASLGEATPRDLGALRDGLAAAPRAAAAVLSIPDASARELLGADVDLVAELETVLRAALVDRPPTSAKEDGSIREGFDAELDEARKLKDGGTDAILALEADLRKETGATSLRVKYARVFGWTIEVTKSHLAKVPATWRRKQTIAGGERYTYDALDQLAADVEGAEARAQERQEAIVADLAARASAASPRIRELCRRLAAWDVASALADVAHRHDYVRPEIDDSDTLELIEARHPVVERLAARGRFVPNDVRLAAEGERLWLITGPNMAGKSTLMRQTALAVILAQAGSYVPARTARIGVVDRLLSRVGASDNVARGESTFMVEMRETAAILRSATRRSLVVLDEIGRGTSTYDGLAIAWAVAEHLHDAIGCRALFATHYHELTELSRTSAGLVNVSVSAREHDGGVVFLHSVQRGPASRSYGIAVARLAGVPESVLGRARAVLHALEANAASQAGAPISTPAPRAAGKRAAPQLDLFAASEAAPPRDPAIDLAIDTIRSLDVGRTTPLDALSLLAKLQASIGGPRLG
jgi:DNA mismatch repair protein MutS